MLILGVAEGRGTIVAREVVQACYVVDVGQDRGYGGLVQDELQRELTDWVDPNPRTKTAFVYG